MRREITPNIFDPFVFDAKTPASPLSCAYTIAKSNIPATLIAVTASAFGS
jgi:hypothetical protein